MNKLIIVRGGGDLASGIIHKLYRSGYHVLVLECPKPTAIRRHVSFCEAIYQQTMTIEGVKCEYVQTKEEACKVMSDGNVALMIDETGKIIEELKPDAVVDAILAKRNLGTHLAMAPVVIGVGPGFEAKRDVHVVIETKRGHHLGRIYCEGSAMANTGIPGVIEGYGKERVIHAPFDGKLKNVHQIGDIVQKDEIIAYLDNQPVYATIDGVLRGILRDDFIVWKGLKMADIDPRLNQQNNCNTISDKARCIAGGVLEALCMLGVRP